MSAEKIKEIEQTAQDRMSKSLVNFKRELATIRAGRANPSVLDKIQVEYYGSKVHIKEIANISVPEPRILMISLWDTSSLNAVMKAIQASDIGINPSSDGKVIRLVFPELTEERRKEIVKLVKKLGEEVKISIRSIRRDSNEQLKKLEKEGSITEDELKRGEDTVQKHTDNYIKDIDAAIADKEKEILEF
ncbi:MAG TPA: ribosome recycling factor [Clostridia bacterium]|nr:ribosome recycling factor [Clostridia bacterium]